MRVADYIMDALAKHGVRHVFFVPGGGAMHLNDALGAHPGLEAVCNLHEQASAVAADAYAKITGGLGACLVTTGPGSTNAITGVAGAWLDSTPVVYISGQVKRADLKRDSGVRILGVQEIGIVEIVRSITKYAVTVEDPDSIRYHLEKAIHLATTGRRGPVWLDIPLDVQPAKIDPEALAGFTAPAVESDRTLPEKVAALLRVLSASKRPVVIAGMGIRMAGAADGFSRIAEKLGAPVLLTWLGQDLLPYDHALCFDRPGSLAPRGANFTLQNSDALLTIGARLDMAMTAYNHSRFAAHARKAMVDIDPAEIAKMKCPIELSIVADAAAFLAELERQLSGWARPDWSAWLARCRDWKERYPIVTSAHRAGGGKLSMYQFSEVLSDALAPGDVIAGGSSGFAVEIFLLCLRTKTGQRQIHARGTGAMGIGAPYALGAAIASGRRTVCVDGDGGFQMNSQELAVVAARKLPVKFFIVDNFGYASIRTSQRGYFGRLVGADPSSGLALPNLEKLAAAYGLPYSRVDGATGLTSAVRRVLDAPGPAVCEVGVQPDEERVPRASSYQKPDGSMASKPIEDLYPFLERDEFRRNMIVPIMDET